MSFKSVRSIAGALFALGLCAPMAYAYPEHHGSPTPGMKAVWTVLQPNQKATAKEIFKGARPTLKTDCQNVRAAREALAQALVSGGDVATARQRLESAQNALLEEKINISQQVTALLNSSQRAAATQLLTEVENARQQIHGYFQQARAQASGVPSSSSQASPAFE